MRRPDKSRKIPVGETESPRSRKAKLEPLKPHITERKKAAEALQRSKKEWMNTFNAISDWVVLMDLKGRILRTNRAGEDFTAVPLDEIIWQSCCRLVHGSDRHIPGCPLKRMLETSQRASAELQVPDTDQWLMVTVDPVTDEEGKIIGAVHITCDITERKQAEKALQKSEKRYRMLAERMNDGLIIIDENGRYVYVNKKMGEILGYSIDEMVGRHWMDFHDADARKTISKQLVKRRKGLAEPYEVVNTRRDGEKICLRISPQAIFDEKGKFKGSFGVLTDITERKKTEQEIEKLARFPSENPNPVLRIFANGLILYNNKAALPLLNAWSCRRKNQLLSGRWYQYVVDALSSGQNQQAEAECGERIFSLTFAPVVDSNYVNVYALDITERKKAEQKIQDYEAKLRALASETLFIEERERQKIATELHDNVGQKLALAKFDLQSSMRSISDAATLASLNNLCAEIDNIVEDIRLLTFEISNPVLNELGLTAAIEKYLSEEIRQKHRIEAELNSDIRVDNLEGIVRRCLYRNTRELLVNVVKHANAHKVKVRIHHSADRIQICVEDDGIGFDVNKIASLPADTEGFGLFSIREQLEYIEGNLQIESDAGKGARVTITAPLKS